MQTAPDARTTQYFEMIGNRAIYHEGWFAGTIHKAPWEAAPRRPLTEDVWELYNVNEDFSQANNLAEQNPEKLEELKNKFMEEAVKYNVLPIDDRSIERFDPVIAGRPDLMNGRTKLVLYEGATGIPENAFINVKEHLPFNYCRGKCPRKFIRSDRMPGRRFRRMDLLYEWRKTCLYIQLCGHRTIYNTVNPECYSRQAYN